MYNNLAKTGLPVAGVLWFGVGLLVLGGAVLMLMRLGPRVAIETVPTGFNERQLMLTVNGKSKMKIPPLRRKK